MDDNRTDNLTIDNIRDEIIKFKNDLDFQKLEKFYYSKSFSEILGVSRREISHSRFIAWLLNNLESHNLGYYTIKKFLDILFKHSNEKHKAKYKDFFNAFVTDDYLINGLKIFPEHSIVNVGRVDIYIELILIISGTEKKIKLIIENKVESKENNDQTNKYFTHFEKSIAEHETSIYVYLTPISSPDLKKLTEPECNCKHYIHINYQSLVDYLLEPALNQNISEKTKNIITEYLQSLSQPSIDDEIAGHKQELIMALGNEERKLLSSFWDKNKKLILATLDAIRTDPEQDEDTRDSINVALENLSQDKDRSKFNISYNGIAFVSRIMKSDVGLQTVKLLEAKGLIDANLIDFLKKDNSCRYSLIKKKPFKDAEIKYRKYKTNGPPELIYNSEEFYVARNWGREGDGNDNTEKLIKKITEKFPQIKYERISN